MFKIFKFWFQILKVQIKVDITKLKPWKFQMPPKSYILTCSATIRLHEMRVDAEQAYRAAYVWLNWIK